MPLIRPAQPPRILWTAPRSHRPQTKYLAQSGFYDFLNFFDSVTWYPLGRNVGGTIYPGLMATAAVMYRLVSALHIPVAIRNVCVFTAPLFSGFTAVATFLLAREVVLGGGGGSGGSSVTPPSAAAAAAGPYARLSPSERQRKAAATGLVAAALVGMVPGYISRSVAGSYDNEGVAIFALVFTFYLWVRAVHTGSAAWAAGAALSYFYMVAAWGASPCSCGCGGGATCGGVPLPSRT
jgi:dolichyl-diphosphooligosaccharide--protein glycosyltransferase